MKKRILIALLVAAMLLLTACNGGGNPPTPTKKDPVVTPVSEAFQVSEMKYSIYSNDESDMILPYRFYVPEDYNEDTAYPVFLFLHGAGERGSDNQSQLKNMVAELFNQTNSKYIDAIVVCPQCPSGQQWVDTPWANGNYSVDAIPESNELATAYELVEWTKYNLSTDHNRYYMMGLSMGGFGTWDMIMRHRDSFTAAVALCGGADVSYAEYLKDFPIWAVHSSNDYSVPYAGTQAMCQALENAGSTVYTFETKSSGHNVWGYAGGSTEIADWLFSQGVTE